MAFVVRGTENRETGCLFVDDIGRVFTLFPDNEKGLNQAVSRAAHANRKRQGKIYIPMASDLPSGYAVICVIDYDNNRVYFTFAAPGRPLNGEYDTIDAAYEAAVALIPPEVVPKRTLGLR